MREEVKLEEGLHPGTVSSLFSAIIKGTLRFRNMSKLSRVCTSIPFIASITKIDMSEAEPPRFLRLVNTACPGVSITRIPGMSIFPPTFSKRLPQRSSKVSIGKKLAPIC